MLWARMTQVGSTTVILGTNGFLVRLSSFPISPLLSLQPGSTLLIFFRGDRRILPPPETSSNPSKLVQAAGTYGQNGCHSKYGMRPISSESPPH
jgi:hypothetical protein